MSHTAKGTPLSCLFFFCIVSGRRHLGSVPVQINGAGSKAQSTPEKPSILHLSSKSHQRRKAIAHGKRAGTPDQRTKQTKKSFSNTEKEAPNQECT